MLLDCIAGYGIGGSTVAMSGRVGGGIYTKAADVGAVLCGKVVANLDEDDSRNPATIADNVGDNVGDLAGMGAGLFGSFAESIGAALVIAAATVRNEPHLDGFLLTGMPCSFTLHLSLWHRGVGDPLFRCHQHLHSEDQRRS